MCTHVQCTLFIYERAKQQQQQRKTDYKTNKETISSSVRINIRKSSCYAQRAKSLNLSA